MASHNLALRFEGQNHWMAKGQAAIRIPPSTTIITGSFGSSERKKSDLAALEGNYYWLSSVLLSRELPGPNAGSGAGLQTTIALRFRNVGVSATLHFSF
jgi:hypothetical protein